MKFHTSSASLLHNKINEAATKMERRMGSSLGVRLGAPHEEEA